MSAVAGVRDQIVALLTEVHASGEAKLPSERSLAARFGVSRSTVREALRGLADQGGIVANHGSAWVMRPDTNQLAEALTLQVQLGDMTHAQLLESRLVIEPPVASLAARRRTVDDLAELHRLFLFMSESDSDADFLRHDIAFHEQLARSTSNQFFVMAVTPLLLTLEKTRQDSLVDESRRPQVLREHRTILDAVHTRDSGAAARAMWEHIGSFARSVGLTVDGETATPALAGSPPAKTAKPRTTPKPRATPKSATTPKPAATPKRRRDG